MIKRDWAGRYSPSLKVRNSPLTISPTCNYRTIFPFHIFSIVFWYDTCWYFIVNLGLAICVHNLSLHKVIFYFFILKSPFYSQFSVSMPFLFFLLYFNLKCFLQILIKFKNVKYYLMYLLLFLFAIMFYA